MINCTKIFISTGQQTESIATLLFNFLPNLNSLFNTIATNPEAMNSIEEAFKLTELLRGAREKDITRYKNQIEETEHLAVFTNVCMRLKNLTEEEKRFLKSVSPKKHILKISDNDLIVEDANSKEILFKHDLNQETEQSVGRIKVEFSKSEERKKQTDEDLLIPESYVTRYHPSKDKRKSILSPLSKKIIIAGIIIAVAIIAIVVSLCLGAKDVISKSAMGCFLIAIILTVLIALAIFFCISLIFNNHFHDKHSTENLDEDKTYTTKNSLTLKKEPEFEPEFENETDQESDLSSDERVGGLP